VNWPQWDPRNRDCPTRRLLDRIGDRWTVLIVGTLAAGPKRFSDLARDIDGISQKMLTQTLRGMERDGLVTRTLYAQVPPRVDYELTDAGHSLRGPLHALEEWVVEHMSDVLAAREAFDAPEPATSQPVGDEPPSRR
jgi:DNA-binding HxlR family transcriptional regulator